MKEKTEMMMEEPEMEIALFEKDDIITASCTTKCDTESDEEDINGCSCPIDSRCDEDFSS